MVGFVKYEVGRYMWFEPHRVEGVLISVVAVLILVEPNLAQLNPLRRANK